MSPEGIARLVLGLLTAWLEALAFFWGMMWVAATETFGVWPTIIMLVFAAFLWVLDAS